MIVVECFELRKGKDMRTGRAIRAAILSGVIVTIIGTVTSAECWSRRRCVVTCPQNQVVACHDPGSEEARRQTVGQMGAFLVHIKTLLNKEQLSDEDRRLINVELEKAIGNPTITGTGVTREQVEAALASPQNGGFSGEILRIRSSLKRLQGQP